jgi:hypothetical protein
LGYAAPGPTPPSVQAGSSRTREAPGSRVPSMPAVAQPAPAAEPPQAAGEGGDAGPEAQATYIHRATIFLSM